MLGTIGKDFKYKLIDNFLTNEEQKLLSGYCELYHRNNLSEFEAKSGNVIAGNFDTFKYGDYLMESLLMAKRPLIENNTNKKLLPTYSYFRVYTYGADLKKHKDRPSCEISITVNIGSDGTDWPIYMDGTEINLKPGQGCVYLGMEVEHYRKKFLGDWCMQVFMHYVDKEGKHADCLFDKRKQLGALPN